MAPPIIKRRHTDLQLESVARISSFPIVESSIYIAGNVYAKIKRSNSLMGWGLDTAEQSLALATQTAIPAMLAFNMPIMTIDHLLCKGIDIVEQRVPAVNLPPHLMYWNTREYVNNKFVKPVLIRADSLKIIGNKAANAAVERLVGAINVADQYVDHYLPADPADKIAETCTDSAKSDEKCSSSSKAARTIEHGARFSRKLQRRLTRRTLAEARALKEQGTECIHVLLYVVELLATDPKLAMQKAKELWASLSLPEPENQARPATLEQLLVLFTRETARRIVHLVNGTANLAARTPRRLARALLRISHSLITISEQAFKVINESICNLLANVLLVSASIYQSQQVSSSHSKPKLHFQTNGNFNGGFNNTVVTGTGTSGDNGLTGNCLSLIAKINIVPLPRLVPKSSSKSIIEEIQTGDEDDDVESKKLVIKDENLEELNKTIVNSINDSKKNHTAMRSIFDRSRKLPVKSFTYNGDSMLLKGNKRADKKIPLFTNIKPMTSIVQK